MEMGLLRYRPPLVTYLSRQGSQDDRVSGAVSRPQSRQLGRGYGDDDGAVWKLMRWRTLRLLALAGLLVAALFTLAMLTLLTWFTVELVEAIL